MILGTIIIVTGIAAVCALQAMYLRSSYLMHKKGRN